MILLMIILRIIGCKITKKASNKQINTKKTLNYSKFRKPELPFGVREFGSSGVQTYDFPASFLGILEHQKGWGKSSMNMEKFYAFNNC